MELEKYKALAATTEEKKIQGRHTSCILGHRLHVPLKRYIMFCTSCNKLHVKEKEKWEGRQTGCIDRLHNVLRSLEKDQQHAERCFHSRRLDTKRCGNIRE